MAISHRSTPPSITSAGTGTAAAGGERKVRIVRISAAGVATVLGAAIGSFALVWLLYERVFPFTGVLGFWVCWYLVFLLAYWVMARQQWTRQLAGDRVVTVAFGTGGTLTLAVVLGVVLFVLERGRLAVFHLNFFTQPMAFAGPLSPLTIGGVLHAIVGTVEQVAIAVLISVPLAVAAAVFLSEVGGPLARPVRVIVEAMTALPDIIAGVFVYVAFILTFGMQKSGLAAGIALSVNMIPIVCRASEVVLRLVSGALREASYALGSSQWRTVLFVVLPTARAGLATAVVLGMARAIGETAPVLLVSGITKELNGNPLSGPQMNLPLFIWNYCHIESTTPGNVERGFGAAFALVLVVIILFAIARWVGGSAPGELTRAQRRRIARSQRQQGQRRYTGSRYSVRRYTAHRNTAHRNAGRGKLARFVRRAVTG
jgi:phosphate transport system permease protein